MKGCNNLGTIHDSGDGVALNSRKAIAFYNEACNGGNALGCYNLGYLYQTSDEVRQNKSKDICLYTRACDGGYKSGCKNYRILKKQGSDNDFTMF